MALDVKAPKKFGLGKLMGGLFALPTLITGTEAEKRDSESPAYKNLPGKSLEYRARTLLGFKGNHQKQPPTESRFGEINDTIHNMLQNNNQRRM